MMYWNGMGWGGWIMMTVTVVVFWGLAAAAAVALFRSMRGESAGRMRSRSALELLDQRFARGEIDETEYQQRREVLTQYGTDQRASI